MTSQEDHRNEVAAEKRRSRVALAGALDVASRAMGGALGLGRLRDELRAKNPAARLWVDAVPEADSLWFDRQVRDALLQEMLETEDPPEADEPAPELEAGVLAYRQCVRAAIIVARMRLCRPRPAQGEASQSHYGPVTASRANDLASLDPTRMQYACVELRSGDVTEDPKANRYVGRDFGLEGFDPEDAFFRGNHGDHRAWVESLYDEAREKLAPFVARSVLQRLPPLPSIPEAAQSFPDWARMLTGELREWLQELDAARLLEAKPLALREYFERHGEAVKHAKKLSWKIGNVELRTAEKNARSQGNKHSLLGKEVSGSGKRGAPYRYPVVDLREAYPPASKRKP